MKHFCPHCAGEITRQSDMEDPARVLWVCKNRKCPCKPEPYIVPDKHMAANDHLCARLAAGDAAKATLSRLHHTDKTPIYDYNEVDNKGEKPPVGGHRWLTPREMAVEALTLYPKPTESEVDDADEVDPSH